MNARLITTLRKFQESKERYSSATRHPAGKGLTLGKPAVHFIEEIKTRSIEVAKILDLPDDVEVWRALTELAQNRVIVLEARQANNDAH